MDSGEPTTPPDTKPKSRFLAFKDRLLSPHLKEYRPQAAESQHRQQVEAIVAAPTVVHGTPEGSSCCQLPLVGRSPATAAAPPPAASTSRRTPPPLPSDAMVGDGSDPRRNVAGESAESAGTGSAKSSGLPIAKSSSAESGVHRSQSARGGVTSSTRRTVTLADPPVAHTRACIHGVSSADDVIVASSSNDDISDDAPSDDRPDVAGAAAMVKKPRSPSGFLSRIARKSDRTETRRPKTADSVDTTSSGSRDQTASPVTSGSRGQDFPFIFSLLRASQPQPQQQQQQHPASAHALGRISEGVASGTIERTSPVASYCTSGSDREGADDVMHGPCDGQLQQQRQRATGSGSVSSSTGSSRPPELGRPHRRLIPATPPVDLPPASPSPVRQLQSRGGVTSTNLPPHHATGRTTSPVACRPEMCTAIVAADVHQSGSTAGSRDDIDDVMSVRSDRLPVGLDSFRRNDKLRSSLPVVGATNRSLERPLGIVFLVFRNDTKPGLLPNEITSISTVWALFVRAFPNKLSMPWFETAKWTIWYLDSRAGVYRILQDLRVISDRSILRLEETETCLGIETSHSLPRFVHHSPDVVGKLMHHHQHRQQQQQQQPQQRGRPIRGSASPLAVRKHAQSPLAKAAVAPEEALSCPSLTHTFAQRWQQTTTGTGSKDVHGAKPETDSRDRLSQMETRVDSLAALVRCAILRPDATTGSIDSLTSDTSQVTVQKSPFSQPSPMCVDDDSDEMRQQRLCTILQQARVLQAETQLLRRAHLEHVATVREQLRDTFIKLMNVMTSVAASVAAAPKTVRQQIVKDQGGYCIDAARLDSQLKNLEACVEQLRNDVVSGKCRVVLSDVEAMVLALSHIGRSLAGLKGRLGHLQERMKPVMASEIEVVVQEERFIKEEPHRLDKSLIRCKQLTGTLSTLRKLAMVQNSNVSSTGNQTEKSSGKLTCGGSVENIEESQQQKNMADIASSSTLSKCQISEMPSSSELRTLSDTSLATAGTTSPTGRLGILKKSSLPSSLKGRSGQFDASLAAMRQTPPPVPPPRKFVLQSMPPVQSPGVVLSPDVWQRHDVRSICSGSARRRTVAAAAHQAPGIHARPLSAPKSCPSSPSFEYSSKQRGNEQTSRPGSATSSVRAGSANVAAAALQYSSEFRSPSKTYSGVCPSSPSSERASVGSPRRTRLPTSTASHVQQDIT